jgi:anti-sigma factor RsiW
MNCTQVRELLPNWLYGDLEPELTKAVDEHLQSCAACREEETLLAEVRRLLDHAPAPKIRVHVPRILLEARQRTQKRLRRWRRAALILGSVAAVLLVVLCLKLEIHTDGHQLVVRWGPVVAAQGQLPAPKEIERPAAPLAKPQVTAAEMKLVKDLLHALAGSVEARDARWQQALARFELQLTQLEEQARTRWAATESYVSALHTSQLANRSKGDR